MATIYTAFISTIPAICNAGIPWETPLAMIRDSLGGPVVRTLAVITVILTGITVALGEGGGWVRRGIQIVCGLSIALLATSFISELWPNPDDY